MSVVHFSGTLSGYDFGIEECSRDQSWFQHRVKIGLWILVKHRVSVCELPMFMMLSFSGLKKSQS